MKKVLFLSMAFIALFFVACNNDDDNNNVTPVDNELSGDISGVKTLDATIEYKLVGALNVVDGGTLNIPAGTVIKAEKGFNKYILVEMGGKINISGTSSNPVVMTSSATNPAAGDWGGLIINGKATVSGANGGGADQGSTEVNPAYSYGGNVPTDNSGTIQYLILEYTGAKSSADVEHNGLTLNAVGSGTTIENIFVINGADDGIEFFGGSVNVTNLLVVNSDDDMFDVTQGWTGTLNNAYGIWEAGYTSGEKDPRGIESDGNLDGLTPADFNQSNFTMTNITIVNNSNGFEMHDAIKVRRGATATITNVLITGGDDFKDIIDLTDGKGDAKVATTISYKLDAGITPSGNEVNQPTAGNATVATNATNTGANTSVFAWTGYFN